MSSIAMRHIGIELVCWAKKSEIRLKDYTSINQKIDSLQFILKSKTSLNLQSFLQWDKANNWGGTAST